MVLKVTWLGSTDTNNAQDARRHVASHILSQATPGSVLVPDSKGALKSSNVTLDELAHVAGTSSNMQQQSGSKLSSIVAAVNF